METVCVAQLVVSQIGCQRTNSSLGSEGDDTRAITTTAGLLEAAVGAFLTAGPNRLARCRTTNVFVC